MRTLTRRACAILFLVGISSATGVPAQSSAPTLDIYFIDTEGGQATLFVTPAKQTVLIDTGNPGERDLDRILAVFAAAGVSRIDHLLLTHYHSDHVGGVEELARRVPIANFVDHGPSAENTPAIARFEQAYAALRARARHQVVRPGDRIDLEGIDWRIVSSAREPIATPLPGAGQANPFCEGVARKDTGSGLENDASVGSVISFGRFSAIDLGDLVWNEELDLVCPVNRIGEVDLYITTHHGLAQSGAPPLVHGIRPRVAVMNNGTRKGGAIASFETLHLSPGLEDLWQLHWSHNGGLEHNAPAAFIANVDDAETVAAVIAATAAPGTVPATPASAPAPTPPPHSGAAHWIKVSARADGTFTVTNTRNGFTKRYD